jgi:hypothetical protein
MVRIAISQAAFDAIAKTLPLGSTGYENQVNEKGELPRDVLDRLNHRRGPGESYSDVILRLAGKGAFRNGHSVRGGRVNGEGTSPAALKGTGGGPTFPGELPSRADN